MREKSGFSDGFCLEQLAAVAMLHDLSGRIVMSQRFSPAPVKRSNVQ